MLKQTHNDHSARSADFLFWLEVVSWLSVWFYKQMSNNGVYGASNSNLSSQPTALFMKMCFWSHSRYLDISAIFSAQRVPLRGMRLEQNVIRPCWEALLILSIYREIRRLAVDIVFERLFLNV